MLTMTTEAPAWLRVRICGRQDWEEELFCGKMTLTEFLFPL